MTKHIPNILDDHIVRKEIEEHVERLMNCACGHLSLVDEIKWLLKQALETGYVNGYRKGYKEGGEV